LKRTKTWTITVTKCRSASQKFERDKTQGWALVSGPPVLEERNESLVPEATKRKRTERFETGIHGGDFVTGADEFRIAGGSFRKRGKPSDLKIGKREMASSVGRGVRRWDKVVKIRSYYKKSSGSSIMKGGPLRRESSRFAYRVAHVIHISTLLPDSIEPRVLIACARTASTNSRIL